MKIYTYYENINFPYQNELIELWKISWSRQGYEPIVLNLEDAKKHPYFNTLYKEIQSFAIQLGNHKINRYGMSCWLRWLAYATQTEERFYVSDYDVINVNFPITEPNDKLHLIDSACPCFASGTPKQFENLCRAFIEITNERLEILKTQTVYNHDQEFFQYNLIPQYNDSAEDLRNQYNILMTRDRTSIGCFYDPILKAPLHHNDSIKSNQVYHIAHTNIENLKTKYPQYSNLNSNKLRVDVVKMLLNDHIS